MGLLGPALVLELVQVGGEKRGLLEGEKGNIILAQLHMPEYTTVSIMVPSSSSSTIHTATATLPGLLHRWSLFTTTATHHKMSAKEALCAF